MNKCTGCRLPAVTVTLLVSAALWGLHGASASEVYRTVDEHGNVMFTDQPPEGDVEAESIGDINVGQPLEVRERRQDRQAANDAEEDVDALYDGVEIVFPPAEEATRRVTGDVPVRVSLKPDDAELAPGHRVRIVVDGTSEGEAPSTEVVVGPLNPGPHNLRAEVVTAEGETIVTSPEIKFYLIRQTANN